MLILIAGLIVFLGTHALRVLAPGWRERMMARLGLTAWRALVSVGSLGGLALIVWGFAQARWTTRVLWLPPFWTRHAAALLVLIACVLLAAFFVPRNAIKTRARYPVTLAVAVWACAHLLANGKVVDAVLFGAFLLWAVWDLAVLRRQDRRAGTGAPPPGTLWNTLLAIGLGIIGWALFVFWLHVRLMGVAPLIWTL
jgi:uncharacterized membrane protein